ncbi:hypothetical protein BH10BAC5_BH10BAC5_25550 [soil metagenome]
MSNLIGKTIQNYKILSQIGEGGMGVVYLAIHNQLDRKVAVKVLSESFFSNNDVKNRFVNEANVLSRFSHPNIVSVYDFLNYEDQFLLIMEYVDGIGMDSFIKEPSQKITDDITINIFSQILDAFYYSHQNNIVHRDIKPSNIILLKDLKVKILDFGIVKNLNADFSKTKTGMKMGSVLYMSPEQILGKEIDQRSDVYAIGITLYEFLTRKNPYDSPDTSEFEIQSQIINQDIDINSVPEKFRGIVQKAAARDPQDRFQNCMEFKSALTGSNYSGVQSNFKENNFMNENQKNDSFAKTRIVNNPQSASQNYPPPQQNNTIKIILICLAVFIVLAAGVYFVLSNKNENKVVTADTVNVKKDNSATENNQLKQRELDLKEQELRLKEKELDQKKNDKYQSSIETQPNRNSSNSRYRYPEASERYLTPSDLSYIPKSELELMRNEIFARHGYIFTKNEKMIRYFSSQSWYNPTSYDVNNQLSQIEKSNISLIKSYEK